MRIATVNRKGGVGKTTSAVHLATLLARRGKTLLVDADPDQSALRWLTTAGDIDGLACVSLPTHAIHTQIQALSDSFSHVVIDTPPGTGADPIVRSALLAVDTVIVPTSPSLADVDRLRSTVDFVAAASDLHSLVYAVLLTRVRRGTTSAREARPVLEDLGHPVLDAEIPLREAIAASWGESAPACTPDYEAVLNELGLAGTNGASR